jgi:hypothetical protein
MAVRSDPPARRVGHPALSRDELNTLLGAAAMAPSIFNTQPWQFAVDGRVIQLYLDPERVLNESVDPFGRQAIISCGAALLNLRVAAAHIGRSVETILNAGASDHPLATLTFGPRARRNPVDGDLYPAIRQRHTYRAPFAPRRVPGSVLFELTECARAEHANVVPVGSVHRRWLFDLVAFAEVILSESPSYKRDLRTWTSRNVLRADGIPAIAFGAMSDVDSPPMRDFGGARGLTQRRERFMPDPWIAVLGTDTDDPIAWLHAGQALQRLLLTAQTRGLSASFLNQPLDELGVGGELFSAGFVGFPQMILRVGYGAGLALTPRRPLTDVIRGDSGLT